MAGRTAGLEVEIGELVVDGGATHPRDSLARAVERELARLLARGELPAGLLHDREVGVLDGGTAVVARGAEEAGEAIARAVHAALLRGLDE